jgi:outer membrane protein TolC
MSHLNTIALLGIKFGMKVAAATLVFVLFLLRTVYAGVELPISIESAIEKAQKNDPWLTGNVHKQQAIESMSMAVSSLPDPTISIGLANLPTNGFDFSQEGMTQAKIGISQMFPRGDTLQIKRQQLKTESEAFPYQRQDREAKVAVIVGNLWLDIYRVQHSIALIEKNRTLFEQLIDVADASYSSGMGKTRQQDIVRAQLELTRLEDRLDRLAQQKSGYEGMLLPWLSDIPDEKFAYNDEYLNDDFILHDMKLSTELPKISPVNSHLVFKDSWLRPSELVKYMANHPSLVAIDKKIKARKSGIKLAQQKYQLAWGVSASYGYRADDAMGNSRADLLSVGVTFDLPLFTENKQDKEVNSAISNTEAIKTEKRLLMRKLLASYSSAKGRLLRLKDRQDLYTSKLIPQIHDQAEASLTAYTNDDGDFSEVVRSRIAVLNAEIDELTLNVEEQKLLLALNYFFISSIHPVKKVSTLNGLNNSEYAVFREKNNEQ